MFRQGKARSFIHNLRLASLLSFVAGIVNINGVLSINVLSTNVTGHFAFFAEEFTEANYHEAMIFMVYVLFFLIGAFFSNLLVEIVLRIRPTVSHTIPMVLEMMILSTVALFGNPSALSNVVIACMLLFSMGMQNALVTKVSRATIRTTHLTGLFTDLGIELSQLFFYRKGTEMRKLSKSIYLRLTIIVFFFFGGVLGGFLFYQYGLKALFLAAVSLIIALLYDTIRYGFHFYRRKLQSR